MNPDLMGKWISPMHPEIVKNEPGSCDICGMDLVSAESMGYVSADHLGGRSSFGDSCIGTLNHWKTCGGLSLNQTRPF